MHTHPTIRQRLTAAGFSADNLAGIESQHLLDEPVADVRFCIQGGTDRLFVHCGGLAIAAFVRPEGRCPWPIYLAVDDRAGNHRLCLVQSA